MREQTTIICLSDRELVLTCKRTSEGKKREREKKREIGREIERERGEGERGNTSPV